MCGMKRCGEEERKGGGERCITFIASCHCVHCVQLSLLYVTETGISKVEVVLRPMIENFYIIDMGSSSSIAS